MRFQNSGSMLTPLLRGAASHSVEAPTIGFNGTTELAPFQNGTLLSSSGQFAPLKSFGQG
jgi:hypothetical protein